MGAEERGGGKQRSGAKKMGTPTVDRKWMFRKACQGSQRKELLSDAEAVFSIFWFRQIINRKGKKQISSIEAHDGSLFFIQPLSRHQNTSWNLIIGD